MNPTVHVVSCTSSHYQYASCPTGLGSVSNIRLLRQTSSSPCRPTESYGFDGRSLWVTNGCAGEFEITGY